MTTLHFCESLPLAIKLRKKKPRNKKKKSCNNVSSTSNTCSQNLDATICANTDLFEEDMSEWTTVVNRKKRVSSWC